jgi:hypothetical protein
MPSNMLGAAANQNLFGDPFAGIVPTNGSASAPNNQLGSLSPNPTGTQAVWNTAGMGTEPASAQPSSRGGGGNVFAEALQHVQGWNAALGMKQQPQQAPAQQPAPNSAQQSGTSTSTIPNYVPASANAAAPASYSPEDEVQRQQRIQWYRTNVLAAGLNPNDPNNFPGGVIFDQYGNYITPATTAPTPVPPAGGGGLPTDPNGNVIPPHVDPYIEQVPAPHVDPAPDAWRKFDPFASWQSHALYDQAGVSPLLPKVGEIKTFPNGNIGRWDGNGWFHVNAQGEYAGGWS